jgi:hypothetical protein
MFPEFLLDCLTLEDETERFLETLIRITILHCIKSWKSTDLIHLAAEARNHT